MVVTEREPQPVLIFYAYAREDESLRNELATHLAMMKRQGLIRDWHDRKIGPGKEWKGEIETRLDTAQIILPLISPDFIASDYCYDVEMARAMERHEAGEARVVPIILRPCDWKNAPFSRLQALPTDAKPVTRWSDKDEAFLSVAEGIRMVLDEFSPGRDRAKAAWATVARAATISDQLKVAIRAIRPDQASLARKFMKWCMDELDRLAPDWSQAGERDELLVQAIDRSASIVVEFASVADLVAAMNAGDAALAMYESFQYLLERYSVPAGVSTRFYDTDFDYYKFLGHELFVDLLTFLVREDRWQLIADLLRRHIFVSNLAGTTADMVSFEFISQNVKLLDIRSKRLELRRASLHADILKQRYTEGALRGSIPFEQFMETEFFLFVRTVAHSKGPFAPRWLPWSTMYISRHTPQYLIKAYDAEYVRQLLIGLDISGVAPLREAIQEACADLDGFFRNTAFRLFWNLDVQRVGSGSY